MNEKLERLKDIKTENFIWIIYIGIILLSWYANSKEKKAILYDDEVSRKEYQKLMILILIRSTLEKLILLFLVMIAES